MPEPVPKALIMLEPVDALLLVVFDVLLTIDTSTPDELPLGNIQLHRLAASNGQTLADFAAF